MNNRTKVLITAIVVLALMALITFRSAPACSTPPKDGEKKAKSQLFSVRTDPENNWATPTVWIITDNGTGNEYIVVRTGDGTAMTPRLK